MCFSSQSSFLFLSTVHSLASGTFTEGANSAFRPGIYPTLHLSEGDKCLGGAAASLKHSRLSILTSLTWKLGLRTYFQEAEDCEHKETIP